MDSKSDIKNLGICACKNLRMTSRVVTQYFDKALHSVGLRATQFSMLAYISYKKSSTVGALADALLMDQTTVTRNVEVLRKNGLIDIRIDENDSRKRCIEITELGNSKLLEAIPSWEKAQNYIEEKIGKEKYEEFLDTLSKIQDII